MATTKHYSTLLLLLLLAINSSLAQVDRKKLNAHKVEDAIDVDGALGDSIWHHAPIANNFVMFDPGNGQPVPERFRTWVKVSYSNQAIYVAAMMYDPSPDSILTQLTERDDYDQNTDWFSLSLNPYNDGQNDFNFYVTAAGVQADSRTTPESEDFNWNTVWKSAVSITDSGWICEMRIPYIALRFPETPRKDWGMNMIRNIRRNRTQWSWNFIDRDLGYSAQYQTGILAGVRNIEPPVRLSFMPYISAYIDHFMGNTTYDFNAGLDMKYGINESFTLDMTLIPDFGQVALDQQFVNLSPFENRFDENRQFFTEGTELFSIGNIFYSRRIGGVPKNITGQDLNDTDVVEVQTEYTRLLNAVKVSGRTDNNLGIGILNAITANSYSTIEDAEGNERDVLLEPLTNYNMIVLDQRFNRNSSVSFVNTNVMRSGHPEDANVAGLLTSFYFPRGTHLINASVKRSDIHSTGRTTTGYEGILKIADVSGHWQWAFEELIQTDDYDINDLGFLIRNNTWNHYGEISYQTFEPSGRLNRYSYTLYANHSSLFEPRRYEDFHAGFNTFWLFRTFLGTGFNLQVHPVTSYDYFEPRSPGYYFRLPPRINGMAFISTDYRKTLALDARITHIHWFEFGTDEYIVNLEPRIRLGDHFFGIPHINMHKVSNGYGFARANDSGIYFGRRDVLTITSAVSGRYVFNPTTTLSINLRHLWTGLNYENTLKLMKDGSLLDGGFVPADDINFNTLYADLRFSWWFAPGSEMVLLYRNVIASSGDDYEATYYRNIETVLLAPMQNNLSVKITYFLDYNRVRNIWQ